MPQAFKRLDIFFRKKHIYIQNIKVVNDKNNITSTLPKEITQVQFDLYNSKLKSKQEKLEGIWKTGDYTIGIYRIGNKEKYIGYIIKANNNWKQRQVKLEIYKDENNTFIANYFMGDYKVQQFNDVELVSRNFLKLGNIYLKRIKPLGELNKTVDRYINLIDAEKPILIEVSSNTLLLRIPSFNYSQKKYLDSLILKNHNKIINTENLIIDLRNNGGGAFKSTEKIIPYIYSNPIKIYGYNYLSSPYNNKLWEGFIENPNNSDEFKNYAKNRFKKLNANIGGFVEYYSTGFENVKDSTYYALDTIYKNPKQIGILINENIGSSTEEFLFYAKQSKKVKLFGTKTYGVLDITDMHTIDFPSNIFRLYYCTAISIRLPELPIDEYGIQPDYFYGKTIKPYEWINTTIEILNYK